MDGKRIIKILQKDGWVVNRIKGSHYQMVKNGKAVTVPVHGTEDLGIGLIKSIERETGVILK